MMNIDLNGAWTFKAVDAYQILPEEKKPVKDWMNATVPGTVHTDLLAAQQIPDPFYRMNEQEVQWIDAQQWLYRKEFDVPSETLKEHRVSLIAEGLDTYALIRVNGHVAGESANMFVGHEFEIKQFLKPGRNALEILFDSPVMRSKALEKKHGPLSVALEPHRVYVRKAQYSFGWDWGPRLTTSGIWRKISLEGSSGPRVRHVFARVLSLDARKAIIEVSADVGRQVRKGVTARVSIEGGKEEVVRKASVKGSRMRCRVEVPEPRLWWPNGMGEQFLYSASVSLVEGENILDRKRAQFGIRTARLVRKPDREGESFLFEINGRPVYCKGADWIPSDSFLPRVSAQTYGRLLTMAKDAHMNMIRVWGGGIYEQDVFYDLCDKLGLMIWQDFMFACGEYPQTSWFLREVRSEATKVVRRLRNHPSIVLWCGNNECEWLFCMDHPGASPDKMNGAKIFRDLLPSVCKEFDGSRPYWRSSPFGRGFPNDESNGNHHQWNVWSFWKDYPEYEKNKARFVSEFGFQAPASIRTLEEVTLPQDRSPQSEVMEWHNKQVEGTERLFRFQASHFQVSNIFEEFVYRGQLVQAEALKTAVEHWRRRKYRTAGSLFWQLNDCWPVSSWSVVDSGLRPKAGYYFAKRFLAPLLVSFRGAKDSLEVWVTNDHQKKIDGNLSVDLVSFDGQKRTLHEARIQIGPDISKRLDKIPFSLLTSVDRSRQYLLARLSTDMSESMNRFFFAEPKHLRLPAAHAGVTVREGTEGAKLLHVGADQFLKGVWIKAGDHDVILSDNFFDLDPGSTVSVVCQTPLDISALQKILTVRSLIG